MPVRATPEWLHLSDDEEIVWESRPHPIEMGPGAAGGVALALLGVALVGWSAFGGSGWWSLVGFGALAVGAALAGIRYASWVSTRYVLTTTELYKKRGVVSRDVTQFRLDRIQNTSLEQGVLGRLLGYGTLTVYTAGSSGPDLTLERVPHPGEASNELSTQFETLSEAAGGAKRRGYP
ncbi:PH domain-containing protein [Natrialbaceae archaeon GCM10025810]|uniref:PH domain-containing protein n=1 Tax=Halovalidus salilacus TaxID=3075124 RepID=UPI003616C8D2